MVFVVNLITIKELLAIKATTREMPTRLKRNFIFTHQIYKNRGIAKQPLDLDMSQSV